MNLIQSRVITVLKADLGIYELRIIMKIVEGAQPLFKGLNLSKAIRQSISSDGLNVNYCIPANELLAESSHHYEYIYRAADRLKNIDLSYDDREHHKRYNTPLISNIIEDSNSGQLQFTCASWVAQALVDFSQGYNRYNMENAFQIRNPSSLRMYMLTCSATQTITYSIPFLKGILGAEGKYKQTRDFIKRCIDPAKQELDNRKINGFTYDRIRHGNKVTGLAIKPVKREVATENELAAQIGLSFFAPQALRQYLYTQCDISSREMGSHKTEIRAFCGIPSWQDIIVKIVENQRKKGAGKGYVFAAIRKEAEKYDNYKKANPNDER